MEKLPVAFFIIVLLLVGQFNSIRKSIIIMSTIPLGLIGVIAGLLVGQSFFGFMTLLGIISLAGEMDYILKVQVASTRAYDEFYKRLVAKVSMNSVTACLSMETLKHETIVPV